MVLSLEEKSLVLGGDQGHCLPLQHGGNPGLAAVCLPTEQAELSLALDFSSCPGLWLLLNSNSCPHGCGLGVDSHIQCNSVFSQEASVSRISLGISGSQEE